MGERILDTNWQPVRFREPAGYEPPLAVALINLFFFIQMTYFSRLGDKLTY